MHAPGKADLNLYAYVHGRVLVAVDPVGLDSDTKKGESASSGPSLTVRNINPVDRVFEAARELVQGIWSAGRRFFETLAHNPSIGGLGLALVGAAASLAEGAYTAVGTLLYLEPVGRRLTAQEQSYLKDVFGQSLDASNIKIKEGWFSLRREIVGRDHVVRNNVWIRGDSDYVDGVSGIVRDIHEFVHVWQEQHGNALRRIDNKSYDWRTGYMEGKSWDKLGVEQQAELIPKAYHNELQRRDDESDLATPLPKELWPIYGKKGVAPVGNRPMDAQESDMQDSLERLRRGEGAPK